ncbi:hypothetical protein CDAR_559871 [Caerostris darwini]|uniref:Uncharacterized protein n=1 Tax=Caerostris darwini TaxID=1538125 RepID=A0AAV4PP25_9ARAC|nr:hypothetical protein CDAR_559871 [Caerostris darwini]
MQGPPPVFPERDGLSMIYSNINSETRRQSVIGRFKEGGTHASGNCFATSLGHFLRNVVQHFLMTICLFLWVPHHHLQGDCHIMAIQQPSMTHIHKTHYHLTVTTDKSPQYRLSLRETTDPLISCLCHEDPPQSEPLVTRTFSE